MNSALNHNHSVLSGAKIVSGSASNMLSDMQHWREAMRDEPNRFEYVNRVNTLYDQCANHVAAHELVRLRLARSLWAKKIADQLVMQSPPRGALELCQAERVLSKLRTLVTDNQVHRLIALQQSVGDDQSEYQLSLLLSEHASYETALASTAVLRFPPALLTRLGPKRIKQFRPIRKRGRFDPNSWLIDSAMSQVEFVDGNPDHVRVRGVELHSGDIGIVELNEAGDGVLECFLEEPGIAPHAMLFVTRRVMDPRTQEVRYQPAAVEIFEGGWRSVPITTALHPRFSWYSEWVRPNRDGEELSADIGERLSSVLDELEIFAFDFQARAVPDGGRYNEVADGSTATCSNFVRVPLERAGVTGLPYPTTSAHTGATANLAVLGLNYPHGIYTPTNILNDSHFTKVGIVDNGQTELSFASGLVIGRPEWTNSFGGWLSQKSLCLDNLPSWKSVRHWRSSFEALKVKLGQSDSMIGRAARSVFHVTDAEVPKSASETAIAYYLRTAFEAGDIIENHVVHTLRELFDSSDKIWSLEELHDQEPIDQLCAHGMNTSLLRREGWYA